MLTLRITSCLVEAAVEFVTLAAAWPGARPVLGMHFGRGIAACMLPVPDSPQLGALYRSLLNWAIDIGPDQRASACLGKMTLLEQALPPPVARNTGVGASGRTSSGNRPLTLGQSSQLPGSWRSQMLRNSSGRQMISAVVP